MECAGDATDDTLSVKQVRSIVGEVKKNRKIKDMSYWMDPYSESKLGFIGRYQKLTIVVKFDNKRNRKKKLSLFVKSIPQTKRSVENGKTLAAKRLFDNESAFFKKIAPMLCANYSGEKWLPTCYYNENDVIVMQDLRQCKFKLREKDFDDTLMLRTALTTLARFHACSILAESGANLSSCFSDNCQQIGFSFVDDERNTWFIKGVETTIKLAEHLGYATANLERTFARACEAAQPSSEHRNGICHGDIWWNNLMFVGDNKCLKKCVIVDYQTIRYAPLVLDLLQILHCTTTASFRRKSERDMVALYHSVLEETVKKDDDGAFVPSLEDVSSAMDDLRVYGAAVACLYYPMVLVDLDNLEDDFVVVDRTDEALNNMEKSLFYREKIDEAIREMIRIGEQLL